MRACFSFETSSPLHWANIHICFSLYASSQFRLPTVYKDLSDSTLQDRDGILPEIRHKRFFILVFFTPSCYFLLFRIAHKGVVLRAYSKFCYELHKFCFSLKFFFRVQDLQYSAKLVKGSYSYLNFTLSIATLLPEALR